GRAKGAGKRWGQPCSGICRAGTYTHFEKSGCDVIARFFRQRTSSAADESVAEPENSTPLPCLAREWKGIEAVPETKRVDSAGHLKKTRRHVLFWPSLHFF
ncbi:unnamed protein product, partial [Pylaiella littoralis]